MQKRIYGLLGFPLTHSFSKAFFADKFHKENLTNCSYSNFEVPKVEDIKLLLHENDLCGFNVTIPYKKLIIPFLTAIDAIAEKVGAVNCVKRTGDNWIGFNTDVFGFENSLKPMLNKNHTKALVLGTGGAAHAVCYVLERLGIEFTKVSSREKDGAITYYDVNSETIRNHTIIINTTPLGTFPKEEDAPEVPYESLSGSHLCYDLIYNPEETLFLKKSKANGAQIKNGYEMLVLQAEESWRIWNAE